MTARISGLYLNLAVDSQWRSRAECGGTGDVMWPEAAGSLQASMVRTLVATYCRVCPVVSECALAGRDEPYGIWGGVYRRKGRAAFDREVAS